MQSSLRDDCTGIDRALLSVLQGYQIGEAVFSIRGWCYRRLGDPERAGAMRHMRRSSRARCLFDELAERRDPLHVK